MDQKKNKLVTHDSEFHLDDIFSTATIMLVLGEDKEYEVVRTRDKKEIESGDFVYDIGLIYDADKNRFDHHQEGGAGKREESGMPYASFGLIWKKYGETLCGSKEVADMIDKKLIQSIDAEDNGVNVYKNVFEGVYPYELYNAMISFNITWEESIEKEYENFMLMVEFAKKIIKREIEKAKSFEKAKKILDDIYNRTEDKRIIVLDVRYPHEDILNKYPEPLFVVEPRHDRWSIRAVRDSLYSYENRKDLPESWAGKSGEELAKITGISDANFCHNKRFVASAMSKEGAIEMARLAVEN